MPADVDPAADPDRPARCPRKLPHGRARCLAIVLVRDADEHERYHDELDELLLTAPVPEDIGVTVSPWPAREQPAQLEHGSHL